ncbi:HIRAN domain-containing protein [Streptococcus uberis]|uniref:HIRAN domain-containing protein n=1 Tax=Streptococcus uberis TaxID=1349 RepID=UPI003D6AB9A7
MIYKENFFVAGIRYRKANLRKIIEWLEYDYEFDRYEDNGYLKPINSEYYTQNVSLVREPENDVDKNAIKVLVGKTHLGYVPKKIARKLAPLLDKGFNYIADLFLDEDFDGNINIGNMTVFIYDIKTLPKEVPDEICDLDNKVIPLNKIEPTENIPISDNDENSDTIKENNQQGTLAVGFIILFAIIAMMFYAMFNQ